MTRPSPAAKIGVPVRAPLIDARMHARIAEDRDGGACRNRRSSALPATGLRIRNFAQGGALRDRRIPTGSVFRRHEAGTPGVSRPRRSGPPRAVPAAYRPPPLVMNRSIASPRRDTALEIDVIGEDLDQFLGPCRETARACRLFHTGSRATALPSRHPRVSSASGNPELLALAKRDFSETAPRLIHGPPPPPPPRSRLIPFSP